MNDEHFYIRRRLKELRSLIQNSLVLSDSGSEHQEVVKLFDDLAVNLARKSRADYKKTYFFIIRCMGELVKSHAEKAYAPYGVKNPFIDSISLPKPMWKWPVVNQPPSSVGGSIDPKQWRDFSALKMYGYTVGKTDGWSKEKRENFLSDFIEMNLPLEVVIHFQNEYSTPLSTGRLRKVANVIASNATNFYRNDAEKYAVAIADWESDLAFLKKKYYEGKGLKFQPWPDTIYNY